MACFFECTFQIKKSRSPVSEILLRERKGHAMKVMLFFDGNNFFSQMRGEDIEHIDFGKLAQWIVQHVNGTQLVSAGYYTGIRDDEDRLYNYLERIERTPGFFVKRFPVNRVHHTCSHCNRQTTVHREKEVDTTISLEIAHAASLATVDSIVLFSGDSDFVPAIEHVRRFGKPAYIATWGMDYVSKRLVNAAYAHIDLRLFTNQIDEFIPAEDQQPSIDVQPSSSPQKVSRRLSQNTIEAYLREIMRAGSWHEHDPVGTTSVRFRDFLKKFKSLTIDEDPAVRQSIVDQLNNMELIEKFRGCNGMIFIRTNPSTK